LSSETYRRVCTEHSPSRQQQVLSLLASGPLNSRLLKN
jgi:hypothetical protein